MSDPLRLGGVPEHFNLPWHLALESDSSDGVNGVNGVAAVWEDQYGGTGEMLAKLESGELDVVSILTEGTVAAIEAGLAVTIVQVYVESPLEWGVHVPAAAEADRVDQLEGRRIAISRHRSGSHLMAFVQAERRGWRLGPEQFVVVGGLEGARSAFAEGEADLFLWDRFMTEPLVLSGEFQRVGIEVSPWPPFVIAVRDEVLLERTTEVGTIVDTVVGAANGLHSMPGVVDSLVERYGLTPDGAAAWLDATAFAPRGAFDPQIATSTLSTLRRAGFTD